MAQGEGCAAVILAKIAQHCSSQEVEEAAAEAGQVVELLDLRQGGLAQTLEGGFPELRASAWHSEAAVQAAVQARAPCRKTGNPQNNSVPFLTSLTHIKSACMPAAGGGRGAPRRRAVHVQGVQSLGNNARKRCFASIPEA